MKIAVLGYSGSGKSTLAGKLAGYYRIPILFLDTVQFLPGWAERGREEGRSIVSDFLKKNDSWVIDGNYECFLQKERLEQADRIILLCFPRRVCLYRAVKRYLRFRGKCRESMAAGCAEKFDLEFLWWILREGRTGQRRGHYREIASRYREKTVVLKKPGQSDEFLKRILKN
ncbi:DNA topology modulation protein FlaR [Caproicibacter sp. BJN0012]|uniref:DNA topology modulation protein FlaR n=1 Tax=Caproicibacter sp. BJN0012 TaxID=3110227 RepID=UPI002E166589